MKRSIRAVSATVAFWLLMWPLVSALILQRHKHIVHMEIKHGVESMLAEDMVLEVSEFPGLQGQREFDYRGERYDIISIARNGNHWKVKAVNDRREKALERGIESSAKGKRKPAGSFWLKIENLPETEASDPDRMMFIVDYRPAGSCILSGYGDVAEMPPEPLA